jgi:hypothetical protein
MDLGPWVEQRSMTGLARLADRIRYEGTLVNRGVVAGIVETTERSFTLTLTKQPCTTAKGRLKPVTAVLAIRGDEVEVSQSACGDAFPSL